MRILLVICGIMLVSVCPATGQDWTAVDFRTRGIRSDDPATLARMLTAHCTNERDKARSIFRWIADNIQYHRTGPRPLRLKDQLRGYQLPEDTGALPSITERVAIKVLKDRQTHCEGFARLFQSLCEHAGLGAAMITGYARTGGSGRYSSNHAWNAVYFDSAWHLVDVTWAAGHYAPGMPLQAQQYAEQFFMADPVRFYEQHFPDDLRWTMLNQPPAPDEMRRSPFRPRSFTKYSIQDFKPGRGLIEAAIGDTLAFSLRTQNAYRNLLIAPDSLWDAEMRWMSPQVAYLEPEQIHETVITYRYIVNSTDVSWLQLVYNDDVVLRYRLLVTTPIASRALHER